MSRQVIKMKSRGFICVNAHPEGCARNVELQVEAIKSEWQKPRTGARNVLVVGASTGYGLASRIAAAWGFQARTIGVFFEREPEGNRTATAGYYNTAAFHRLAARDGLGAWSLNGDAFSDELKRQAIDLVRKELGPVDLVIYSLASPKRVHPSTGKVHQAVLKPVGKPFSSRTVDLDTERVTEVTIAPATEAEIADTVQVMGGEDWRMWVEGLLEAGLLAREARTLAYSYIGPEVTWPMYKDGTIGEAKKDLYRTASHLDAALKRRVGGHAWVSVNKAIVTQASAAIPVVPLYMSILSLVMGQQQLEEGAIEQMRRLFFEHLGDGKRPQLDPEGRIRLDDREMLPEVQAAVMGVWPHVTTENLNEITGFAGFRRGFRNLFGFEVAGVDYAAPAETELSW